MSLTCEQADLSHHLASVSRAVASRPALPVLANVLLEADADTQRVALTAFDLNLGIRSEFDAQVEHSARTTLPAKLFSDIVSRLPSGKITLSQPREDAPVTLTSAAGQYQVRGLSAEDYPTLPEVGAGDGGESAQALELHIENLLQGISQTLFAASADETKQVLTGVHVKLLAGDPPLLEFAATDGHRLATAQTELRELHSENSDGIPSEWAGQNPGGVGLDFTIPARTLRELERILSNQAAARASGTESFTVQLRFDRAQVQFRLDRHLLTSRLLDGQYPDYKRLIPSQFERQVTLERRPLMESLERVGVFAAQRNDIIKFQLSAATQTLQISTEAPDVGSGQEFLPIHMSGPDLELAFNVRYLLDALKVFHTQQVSLELNGATQPAIWKPIGAMRLCYLVMPVQLRAT
ncbi:DNA polymerase III subunit beta [Synechococcus bigranulatus str. 'Rupite']|uniref:Beta sliding clamp n=1 Tax=Thermostichus vulcanus str. 'Rupite' TaxID=2813851 RepID=A0ABT0CFS8_THEVL|nr:DNA polymerase III subunit beta [Thermostichus vulcanus str. 'Rupite']